MGRITFTSAAALLSFAAFSPASAARSFGYYVGANVVGSYTVYNPNLPACMGAGNQSPLCYESEAYEDYIDAFVSIRADQPGGRFVLGTQRTIEYSGEIIVDVIDGVQRFSGVNFQMVHYVPGSPSYLFASAPTFLVRFEGIDGMPVASVPEPATWAMLTLGFGAMGFAMRRKKVSPRVRFA